MTNFSEIARYLYPNEPHMQDLVEPKWIASQLKDIGVVADPSNITLQESGSDDVFPCDFSGINKRTADVFVDGKKVGVLGAVVENGKYKGHSIVAA